MEDDGALWIAVADKDIPGAIYLRVVTNKVAQGKGKQKRVRYVCKGSLHSGNNNDNKLDGYTRAQKVFLVDPRGADEAGLLNVRKEFMDIFIERKRKKESDNLRGTDSEESDGECFFATPAYSQVLLFTFAHALLFACLFSV